MPLVIGVTKEFTPGERRVALVPDVAKKYQGLGASLLLESGAGEPAYFRNSDYAGSDVADDAAAVLRKADVVLQVQPLGLDALRELRPGSVLVGLQQPWSSAERIAVLRERNITCFALELLPRISRAQSMDVLSSQAAVAGYECALIAADHCPKFFPMLTYAAGTIRPAKVLVIGAGVAGLAAIGT
ncbi:MAG TPA: NAD(P)(+) transhydrogenase (Re/Si-specific) subunit alpha, partial [Rhodocyclaceae bacterium]|nr:NAD(P)(+) transhydrogenase (Re/Si-specific) subunit alpha [Rhodocyclaceae bacterium]